MLSIQPLKSANAAFDYYTKAADYYANDAQAISWQGKGAEILGLNNSFEKEALLSLLKGSLPTGEFLQNNQGKHRPGFDMTFSAPKSVSLLAGLGVAPELINYHDKAVAFALKKIEEEFAQARINRNGETYFEKTGNLTIATFRQPSSRANDPALHTHCLALNLTFKDGKARSLASDKTREEGVVEQIQNNAHYCGMLYRHHLANSLKEAGFKLRQTGDGLFELEGIPETILAEFSKRRESIEQLMEEKGWVGAKAASSATLLTRDAKEEHDFYQLQKIWQERCKELEFDAKAFMVNRGLEANKPSLFSAIQEKLNHWLAVFSKNQNSAELKVAQACVNVAIETLSQHTTLFTERALKEESLKHSLGYEKAIAEHAIADAIDLAKKEELLYEALDSKQKPLLTTPWFLTLETESIARIEQNKGLVSSVATQQEIKAFETEREKLREYPLTTSQQQAMKTLLSSKDRFLAVQGYAGVAKTSMLKEAKILMEEKGFRLCGITVASTASHELEKKAGIKADVFPVVYQGLKEAHSGSLTKSIFILDEASMLSSPQGHALIKQIERTQARLILVGDKAQLPSVNGGRFFALTQDYGIKTSIMNEVVRQKDKDALESVLHATRGEVRKAISKLSHVEELASYQERVSWIAKHWLSLSPEKREQTLIFAPTHKNRADISELIRQGLREEGKLIGNVYTQTVLKAKSLESIQQRFAASYKKGDVLRFNQSFKQNKIRAGEYYQVAQMTTALKNKDTLPLVNKEGKTIQFPLKSLPSYTTHQASFERIIEVYQEKTLPLQQGETILWGKNFKKEGIRNGEQATLIAIDKETLSFKDKAGRVLTLDKNHPALKHLDYGYVLTNHKVQGKDALYGIGLMESYQRFSATLNHFYVQISRAVLGMTLVTDNKEQLVAAIEQNSGKEKAALDGISSERLIAHEEKFKAQSKLNLEAVIVKKVAFEKAKIPGGSSNFGELSFRKEAAQQLAQANLAEQLKTKTLSKELEL